MSTVPFSLSPTLQEAFPPDSTDHDEMLRNKKASSTHSGEAISACLHIPHLTPHIYLLLQDLSQAQEFDLKTTKSSILEGHES